MSFSPYVSVGDEPRMEADILLDKQSILIIIRPAYALVLELADRHG